MGVLSREVPRSVRADLYEARVAAAEKEIDALHRSLAQVRACRY